MDGGLPLCQSGMHITGQLPLSDVPVLGYILSTHAQGDNCALWLLLVSSGGHAAMRPAVAKVELNARMGTKPLVARYCNGDRVRLVTPIVQ
jgi:hypothetical protein